MKKIYITVASLAAAAALFAAPALFADNTLAPQDTATEASSDDLVTREYDFQGFTKLDVWGRFHVTYTKSNKYSVKVTIPAEAENLISVKMEEGTLKLGWSRNITERFQKKANSMTFTAEISMPELTSLEMGGASYFETKDKIDLPNGEFSLDLSGASKADGLRINARELEAELSGAASCSLTGAFDKAEVEIGGAGNCDFNFDCDDLDLDVNGASDAEIEGKFGRVNAEVSGASTATLTGTAESLSAEVSGASKLRAKSLETKDVKAEVSGASNCTVYATRSMTVEDATGASSIKYKAPKGVDATVRSCSRSSSVTRID